ncbi:MAG: hypothetical protein WC297_02390 [Candidatus Paceibacterota bacterium]|jgi:hypothetical protein
MNDENINNEVGPITPPPKEAINVRTMGSDRQTARQGVTIPYEESHPEPKITRPLEPEVPFAPFASEPEPASIVETVPINEEPKTIPDWAQEKLEEETTAEPINRKAIFLVVIILAVIIGFILIGYFISSKLIFKH